MKKTDFGNRTKREGYVICKARILPPANYPISRKRPFPKEFYTRNSGFALVSDFFRNFALAKRDVHQPKGLTNTFCFVCTCALEL